MMRTFFLLAAILACTAAHAVVPDKASPLFAREATDLVAETALAAREGKRLAILFEREDCSYCEQMRRKVFTARQAIRDFGASFRNVALHTDRDGELIAPDGSHTTPAALAARLRLTGTPAFAFYDKHGSFETRHQGAFADATGLVALGRYVSEGAYETLPFATWRTKAAKASQRARSEVPPMLFIAGDYCTTRPHSTTLVDQRSQ